MDPRWVISFSSFWEDMCEGYRGDLTLDRRDNSLGYNKSNCRWVSMKAQMRNTRVNRRIHTQWGFITVAEAAERSGLKPITIHARLNRGWPEERVLDPIAERYRYLT